MIGKKKKSSCRKVCHSNYMNGSLIELELKLFVHVWFLIFDDSK